MIRIAVTGPESTGKTELTQQLAHQYGTVWIPEFAREYLMTKGNNYNYQDVIYIAREQAKLEELFSKQSNRILLSDTEFIVIKIWLEFKYNKCPAWIDRHIRTRPFDLYLLSDIDIPWQQDPQREHPDKREYFFNRFHAILESFSLPFRVVSGLGAERTQNAMRIIKEETGHS